MASSSSSSSPSPSSSFSFLTTTSTYTSSPIPPLAASSISTYTSSPIPLTVSSIPTSTSTQYPTPNPPSSNPTSTTLTSVTSSTASAKRNAFLAPSLLPPLSPTYPVGSRSSQRGYRDSNRRSFSESQTQPQNQAQPQTGARDVLPGTASPTHIYPIMSRSTLPNPPFQQQRGSQTDLERDQHSHQKPPRKHPQDALNWFKRGAFFGFLQSHYYALHPHQNAQRSSNRQEASLDRPIETAGRKPTRWSARRRRSTLSTITAESTVLASERPSTDTSDIAMSPLSPGESFLASIDSYNVDGVRTVRRSSREARRRSSWLSTGLHETVTTTTTATVHSESSIGMSSSGAQQSTIVSTGSIAPTTKITEVIFEKEPADLHVTGRPISLPVSASLPFSSPPSPTSSSSSTAPTAPPDATEESTPDVTTPKKKTRTLSSASSPQGVAGAFRAAVRSLTLLNLITTPNSKSRKATRQRSSSASSSSLRMAPSDGSAVTDGSGSPSRQQTQRSTKQSPKGCGAALMRMPFLKKKSANHYLSLPVGGMAMDSSSGGEACMLSEELSVTEFAKLAGITILPEDDPEIYPTNPDICHSQDNMVSTRSDGNSSIGGGANLERSMIGKNVPGKAGPLTGSETGTFNSNRNLTLGSNTSESSSRRTNIWDAQFWTVPVVNESMNIPNNNSQRSLFSPSSTSLPLLTEVRSTGQGNSNYIYGSSSAPHSPFTAQSLFRQGSDQVNCQVRRSSFNAEAMSVPSHNVPLVVYPVLNSESMPQLDRDLGKSTGTQIDMGSVAGSNILAGNATNHLCTPTPSTPPSPSRGALTKTPKPNPRSRVQHEGAQPSRGLGRRRSFSSLTAIAIELESDQEQDSGSYGESSSYSDSSTRESSMAEKGECSRLESVNGSRAGSFSVTTFADFTSAKPKASIGACPAVAEEPVIPAAEAETTIATPPSSGLHPNQQDQCRSGDYTILFTGSSDVPPEATIPVQRIQSAISPTSPPTSLGSPRMRPGHRLSLGSYSGLLIGSTSISRTRSPSPSPLSKQVPINEEPDGHDDLAPEKRKECGQQGPARPAHSRPRSNPSRFTLVPNTEAISLSPKLQVMSPRPNPPVVSAIDSQLRPQRLSPMMVQRQHLIPQMHNRTLSLPTSFSNSPDLPRPPSPTKDQGPAAFAPQPLTSPMASPKPCDSSARRFAPGTKVGRFTLVEEKCTRHIDVLRAQELRRGSPLGSRGASSSACASDREDESWTDHEGSPLPLRLCGGVHDGSASPAMSATDSEPASDLDVDWALNPMLEPEENVLVFKRKKARTRRVSQNPLP